MAADFANVPRKAATPHKARGGVRLPAPHHAAASKRIAKRMEELADWRGETLARVRRLIHDADPGIQEEWKWAKAASPGIPVWSHDGIVCTGESYAQVVKLTFARGASLQDPRKLFNASLAGSTRRAIDLREGERLNAAAFKSLIRSAVAANAAARGRGAAPKELSGGTRPTRAHLPEAFHIAPKKSR